MTALPVLTGIAAIQAATAVKQGFIDIYVLQPGDPTKPDDANFVDALRPGVSVIADLDAFETMMKQLNPRYPIRRLRIGGHGNPTGFFVGNTWISERLLNCDPAMKRKLESAKPHLVLNFSSVLIDACKTGQSSSLSIYLAKLWGVPVTAFLGDQYSEPLNQEPSGNGLSTTCAPDERCQLQFGPNLPITPWAKPTNPTNPPPRPLVCE